MRIFAGCFVIVAAVGFGGISPASANPVPSYKTTARCADASGFTARAMRHPDYKHRKVFANPQELAYINRCVAAATGKAATRPRITRTTYTTSASPAKALRGTLPYPSQYPLMSGDSALWPRMTMAQQRRAMLFLRTGSTIQSSLFGD